MKKILLMTCVLGAVSLSAVGFTTSGFTHSREKCLNLRIMNVCHLTECDLQSILRGDHPEIAVEFPAQTILPISFFLKGDLINLVNSEQPLGQVEVKQTFYARQLQNGLMLSINLIEWKPFMEFITGCASVELSFREGVPAILFGAEATKKG